MKSVSNYFIRKVHISGLQKMPQLPQAPRDGPAANNSTALWTAPTHLNSGSHQTHEAEAQPPAQ